jgi:hypothetical protein
MWIATFQSDWWLAPPIAPVMSPKMSGHDGVAFYVVKKENGYQTVRTENV